MAKYSNYKERTMKKRFFYTIISLCKIVFILIVIYFCISFVTLSIYDSEFNSLSKEIDRLEEQGKLAWERIGYLQNKKLVVKPNFADPYSIYLSLLSSIFEERKKVSEEHIFLLRKMMQKAKKGVLRNIRFEGLMLVPRFDIVNGEIKSTLESDNYYLDFQSKEFQESEFINSEFNNLDLTNSNFYKSRFDGTKVIASKLKNVNMQNAILYKVNFYKSLLLDTNAKNINIVDSLFDHTQLINTDFSDAAIINSSFRNSNLQGANFNNAIFIYDDQNYLIGSFKGIVFNSKEIDKNNLDMVYQIPFENYKEYVQCYCNDSTKDQDVKNACINALISSYSIKSDNVKATEFPKEFDYSRFDMIDVSKFFEFVKTNIK